MKRLALALVLLVAALGAAVTLGGHAPIARLLLAAGMPSTAAYLFDTPDWRGVALYRAGRFDEAAAAFWMAGAEFAFNRGDALARAGNYREALTAFDTALAHHPDDEAAAANRALIAALIGHPDMPNAAADNNSGRATKEKDSQSRETTDNSEENKSSKDGMAGAQQAASQTSASGASTGGREGATEQKAENAGEGKANGAAVDADGMGKASITDAVIAQAFELRKKRDRVSKSYEAQEAVASRQWLVTLSDDPGRYLKLRLRAEHARRVERGTALPDGEEP